MGGYGGMGGPMPGAKGGAKTGPGGAAGPAAFEPPPPPPLIIEQKGNEIRVSMTTNMFGQDYTTEEFFLCDGQEKSHMVTFQNQPNPVEQRTKATLKKNRFIVDRTTHYPNHKVEFKREMSFSKDGETIKVETYNANPYIRYVQERYYTKE